MKRYIGIVTKTTVSKMYGGATVTCSCYRVKNNELNYLCDTTWCTRSTRGEVSEVMNAIIDNTKNEIPKKHRGYYRDYEQDTFRVKIYAK